MKPIYLVLFLILTSLLIYSDPIKSLKFESIEFEHAFSSQEGVPVEEYIDKGKTLKNWQYLLAYRTYKDFTKPNEVIKEYLKQINPSQEPTFFSKDNKNDIILVFMIIAPDKTYIEFNIHRFVLEDKIVRSYQFARKATTAEFKSFDEELKLKKTKWLEEIGKLKTINFIKE